MTDAIIAIIFFVLTAIALFANADKVDTWQEEMSKRDNQI